MTIHHVGKHQGLVRCGHNAFIVKKETARFREIAQRLRKHVSLEHDSGSFPSAHMGVHSNLKLHFWGIQ